MYLLRKIKSFFLILIVLGFVAGMGYGGYYLATQTPQAQPDYVIQFDGNGVTVPENKVHSKQNETIVLPELEKEGYLFDGWYTSEGVKWTNSTLVTKNVSLVAKWVPKKYDITFIVDGETTVSSADYDSMPVYTETPVKKSENPHITYKFLEWKPSFEIVKNAATYTAVFEEIFAQYSVTLTSDNTEAGDILGSGIYEYNQSVEIQATENNGYKFNGWYSNNELFSLEREFFIDNIDQDIVLEAKFSLINYTITYMNTNECVNTNPNQYNIKSNDISLAPLSRVGYNFIGWFTASNGTGSKITAINCIKAKNYTLYAYFEIITYSITYNLGGGTLTNENPSSYTIETPTFTLNNPTKTNYVFSGWTGTNLTQTTVSVIISKGNTGNLAFVAKWQEIPRKITFKLHDDIIDDIEIIQAPGTRIYAPTINSSEYDMTGYVIDGWYTESSLENKFTFNKMPNSNLTLYAQWKYFIDEGFYPYLDKFNTASKTNNISIYSYEELVAFVEYIQFNYITEKYPFTIKYTTPTLSLVAKAINDSKYAGYSAMSYSSTCVYMQTNVKSEESTKVADPSKNYIYKQSPYLFSREYTPQRLSTNTIFNINNVQKTLNVSTSNQLIYALEKGLRPVCASGSPAETVYKKATKVLNSICDNSMSDLEKAQAIYEWLINNVQYDHYAAEKCISNWYKYDAWYPEGVFNNGVAVCDGIAKAYIILAKIENIPIVRAAGDAHAWNKIYINNKWYGVDATHGDVGISGINASYLTYNNFLFTDDFKESQGFTDDQYGELRANNIYNYYDEVSYRYNFTEFDFQINNQNELTLLFLYIKDKISMISQFSVEFTIDNSYVVKDMYTFLETSIDESNLNVSNMAYAALEYSTGQTVYLILLS